MNIFRNLSITLWFTIQYQRYCLIYAFKLTWLWILILPQWYRLTLQKTHWIIDHNWYLMLINYCKVHVCYGLVNANASWLIMHLLHIKLLLLYEIKQMQNIYWCLSECISCADLHVSLQVILFYIKTWNNYKSYMLYVLYHDIQHT